MINGQHYTSIFTDASYDHKTKVAGYAVWFRHKDSDPTRLPGSSLDIKDNNHAEALAIQVAIDHFLEKNIDLTDVIVIIQSDCTTALDWFKAKPNPLSSLNPNKNTRGHKHDGLDEVYIFTDIPHNQAYIDVGPEDGKLQRTNITPNMLVTLKGGEFHRVCNLGDQAIKFTCIFQSYDRTSTLK